MPPPSQLQLSEGSSCWSSVHPHLQTQEDVEGGVFKEKKVSATLCLPVVKSIEVWSGALAL